MKASGGFTVPELLISSGILAVVVFGGMTVSRAALRSTQASVLAGEADARIWARRLGRHVGRGSRSGGTRHVGGRGRGRAGARRERNDAGREGRGRNPGG